MSAGRASSAGVYAPLEAKVRALSGDRRQRMRGAADALWEALGVPKGPVSWVGFYEYEAGSGSLVLGPCRDKPACSPIGLHGACGRCWRSGEALVVGDVASLGPGYIACDPRDRSEVVVPLFSEGMCWGVLDADSHTEGSFSRADAESLHRLMVLAGLTDRADCRVRVV